MDINEVSNKEHGGGNIIIETYIPSKKIAFNETSDCFHCFSTGKERYENAKLIGEIEIPKAMAQAMIDYINVSKRLTKTKKWYKRCVLGELPTNEFVGFGLRRD